MLLPSLYKGIYEHMCVLEKFGKPQATTDMLEKEKSVNQVQPSATEKQQEVCGSSGIYGFLTLIWHEM